MNQTNKNMVENTWTLDKKNPVTDYVFPHLLYLGQSSPSDKKLNKIFKTLVMKKTRLRNQMEIKKTYIMTY